MMNMISKTVTSNDFQTIMKEHRAHALKRIADLSVGPYTPSAKVQVSYARLQALPIPASNSDALDNAKKQIKAAYATGAASFCDATQSDLESITKAYESQVQLDPVKALDTLKNDMKASADTDKANSAAVTDKIYDIADQLGANMSQSEQAQLISFVSNVEDEFLALIGRIGNFIGSLVPNLTIWDRGACDIIADFFKDVKSSIGGNI